MSFDFCQSLLMLEPADHLFGVYMNEASVRVLLAEHKKTLRHLPLSILKSGCLTQSFRELYPDYDIVLTVLSEEWSAARRQWLRHTAIQAQPASADKTCMALTQASVHIPELTFERYQEQWRSLGNGFIGEQILYRLSTTRTPFEYRLCLDPFQQKLCVERHSSIRWNQDDVVHILEFFPLCDQIE